MAPDNAGDDLNAVITDAVQAYIGDIKTRDFPNEKEQY